MKMTHTEFEGILTQALIRSTRETWIERASEEALRTRFPDTKPLDEAIRRIRAAQAPAAVTVPPSLYRRIRNAAAMVILSMSILFGALMLHPEARQTIINLVVTWYEDHIKYSFRDKDAAVLPQDWEFGYIPDGFTLLSEERLDDFCMFIYERSDGVLLNIIITNESRGGYLDNEHYDIERISFKNGVADLYQSRDSVFPNKIVWYREDLRVLTAINGMISLDELLLILENMTP
jgi:hypothetical protein